MGYGICLDNFSGTVWEFFFFFFGLGLSGSASSLWFRVGFSQVCVNECLSSVNLRMGICFSSILLSHFYNEYDVPGL